MIGTIRLTAYLAGALAAGATVLAALGWGTYDAETGMFQPPPIHVEWLAGVIVSGGSSALAALAYLRGWARRK